jgi:hypothetical protein
MDSARPSQKGLILDMLLLMPRAARRLKGRFSVRYNSVSLRP